MSSSYFPFIKDPILQKNIDETFNHILDLLAFIESKPSNEISVKDRLTSSAIRKTIVIHTVSIIEALLFYIVDRKYSDKDISVKFSSWELSNEKVLYEVNANYKIVAGDYKFESGKMKKRKMNLGNISSFLKSEGIINKNFFSDIDKVRVLRNGQHLSTKNSMTNYTKLTLESTFKVAHDVKELVLNLNI